VSLGDPKDVGSGRTAVHGGATGVNERRDRRSQRRLRRQLYLGGIVATSAGLHTMLAGGKSFPPRRQAGAMVESELRFYSAFYVAYVSALFAPPHAWDPIPVPSTRSPLHSSSRGSAAQTLGGTLAGHTPCSKRG
jgi:hypothetical protein